MNSDNPIVNNNTEESPIILDIGDNDYVSLYDFDIEDTHIKLNYRYTGNKSNEEVEQILSSIIISSFEKEFGADND